VERHTGTLSLLSDEPPRIPMGADKDTVIAHQNYGLATNARGAMIHARAAWGDLQSQYDALLAANPSSAYPVDRRILLTRLRGWVVYRGYSREIDLPHLDQFAQSSQGTLQWIFTLPIGMGQHVRLAIRMRLLPGQNATSMTVERLTEAPETPLALDGATPVRLILRPDIENRGFHEKTKAFLGPETDWPEAIATDEHGFTFSPKEGCSLRMDSSLARFVHEPEWHYMQAHPIDAERGLDGATDLFSPGYFTCLMRSGAPVGLHAYLPAEAPAEASTPLPDFAPSSCTLEEAAKRAIDAFIVKRDDTKTVIAGYPWFLDWGRDTLICLRGIIAAGRLEDARDIVRQFARFERQGTLPNMIRGGDDSNRDTSDAPLWLFVACADLFRADGHREFAEADCGDGRRLREILSSIARHYLSGTPNGINVDPESGLVFSPSHFTWMDTNHPAGTPREGYPIEIQSLWHHALTLLATLAPQSDWQSRADQVAESILRFFWSSPQDFLSDCLHARPGTRAADALPDDHLRCNQLFAVTLGAVTDETISRAVVRSSEDLLVPGAIRSLADRPVKHLLPVHQNGKLTNDPAHPYWGHYQGDEDTRRKPAYHNGTAWTWPFPSYAEALALTHGPSALPMARAILSSSAQLFADGCLGHLPEITDGDAPHAQRGCGAQAWGVTELYRVLHLLEN
jgi:glycogen debranching enzyme